MDVQNYKSECQKYIDTLCPPEVPPPGFDPLKESNETLVKLGFPPRPSSDKQPQLRARWNDIMSKRPMYVKPEFGIFPRDQPPSTFGNKAHDLKRSIVSDTTNTTWSGAVLSNPTPTTPIKVVYGNWGIPNVKPPQSAWNGSAWNNGQWQCSIWVGLDGFNEPGGVELLQAGTVVSVTTSGGRITAQTCTPFFEWWPNLPVPIANPVFHIGDEVGVTLCAPLPGQGATVSFYNLSTNQATSVPLPIPAPANVTSQGLTAEWIMEDPAFDIQGLHRTPFPDFGQCVFTECGTGASTVTAISDATLWDIVVNGQKLSTAERLGKNTFVVRS